MLSGSLIGVSKAHRSLLATINRVARTDAEVLFSGPSGVGKELYARHLHQVSERQGAKFVAINCGAFPPDLFENELFGHVSGAFTGARPHSDGLITEAQNGTLFLDEVDSLSPPCQVKLLRFLQEKEYRRLGETKLRRANVRIVAAANTSLYEGTKDGRFREDLFFRLRVVPIEVPSLCQRPDDIPPLIEAFITHYADSYRLPKVQLSDEAYSCLLTYSWPGNVRELENCIKCLTCLQVAPPVTAKELPLLKSSDAPRTAQIFELPNSNRPLREIKRELVKDLERKYLEKALQCSGGNITQAALASGKPRRVFFELMRKYGIRAEEFRENPFSRSL